MKTRTASVQRKTRETDIAVRLNLDGSGEYRIKTGIPFLNHMLDLFAKHGLFDLTVRAKGDLEVDYHHTVEDVGLALGEAFNQALGDRKGINRYGWSVVLPALSYPLRILGVLMVVGSLKLFDLPYLMTTGGPGNATVTLGITLYRHGFINWQYGKAAAIGVVILVLSLAFTVVQFSWRGKESE